MRAIEKEWFKVVVAGVSKILGPEYTYERIDRKDGVVHFVWRGSDDTLELTWRPQA